MLKQVAESLANLIISLNQNLATKTYFAQNNLLAMAGCLIVDFTMQMLGFAFLNLKVWESTTGLNTKMEHDLEGKHNVQVSS